MAVTGDDHEKLEPIVTSYGFEAIRNDHPELGQGVSIAMGVRHLMNTSSIPLDGILCSVGDQPLLTSAVVHEVIRAFNENFHPKIIVVPHYGANYHREILFSLVLIGLIIYNRFKDQGGKTIIHGDGKAHVVKLWISDDIGDDIDTPDDFERLKHRESEAL